ncbi:E3 ubiquitin-protein ligase SINAT5-like [Argentina anserina]|uniref:E3 ubiquitin-protein ligase SINAT5-like n=1 Tax=Argentina anserina TaxID=57926 RepID=UPI0021767C9B|nr:E3 ubiquitin-protein ligase SINAT5-like [Potentilla anserina]
MEDDGVECLSSCDEIYEKHIYHRRRRLRRLPLASTDKCRATNLHELLKCPVCTKSMYPPINQCLNGHTLCSICKLKVKNCCPTCREELGDIRCLALEKVAESLELPCKYSSFGCLEIFPYYRKVKHEARCDFRPYSCPHPGPECSAVGDIAFLLDHLRVDHKVDMHNGCSFDHLYVNSTPRETENAAKMLMVFSCYSHYFCLHFEAFQLGIAPVYIAFLRFMGDAVEARTFSYRLEVGAHGRKLIWEGTPRSIRESHQKVRDSHDGLIIQRNMALFFSTGERKKLRLRVTGRIWKAAST